MKKVTQILIFAFIGVVTVNTAKAQTYDPLAVQRINDLIVNNGLKATPNAPETWNFAEWNNENPKKIVSLELPLPAELKGDASFAGLTTLQNLACNHGYLTKLDLTNCTQLQTLFCNDNYLTEINFNSKQLQKIGCLKNNLSKLDISDCDKLYELNCYSNNLTELDVRNCTQLNYLSCSGNNLTVLDVTNCSLLNTLHCNENKLISLDLSKSDALHYVTGFVGGEQNSLPLTLYKNEEDEYSIPLNLNSPVFGNTAISYENGVLKSKDSTVFSSSFTVQTGKDGFELSGTMNFNYSDDVGIDPIDDAQLTVYPNPVTGELIVTSYALQVTNVEIYDISGRKQKAESRKEKAEIVIDISHLPAGIYLVKVITEKGEVVKKIVKQ